MKLLSILLFLCLLCAPTYAAEKTLVRNQAEATKLLGRHLFASPWISGLSIEAYNAYGVAEITNVNGVYKFSAEHENYYEKYEYPSWDDGGYIRLKGNIVEIKEKQFYLDGVLEYYKYNQNRYGDMACRKEGLFLFASNGHPAYWRVQQRSERGLQCKLATADKSQPEYTDSGLMIIDIFTAQLAGEPPSGRKEKRPNPTGSQ